MEYFDLPPIPPDLGFDFKNHSIDSLFELWDVSRSTITKRIAKVRDLLGTRVGHIYTADQVIIMCMIWEPPDKYYRAFKFMESHGWTKFIAKKYGIEKLLDPKEREKIRERYGNNKKRKRKK